MQLRFTARHAWLRVARLAALAAALGIALGCNSEQPAAASHKTSGRDAGHTTAAKDDAPAKRDSGAEPNTAPDSGNDPAAPSDDKPAATNRHGGEPGVVISEPQDDAEYVFDPNTLRTYNVLIDPADLALLDLDPAAEVYVDAKVEVDGETYGPVSVRYKGSVGSFYTPCTAATGPGQVRGPKAGKCSIKIDFDRIDDKLRFHGLKKLNLHSMGRDKSLMRERLGYGLFREFGVAAPRATHARVLINGELEGLFVAVEQIDGRFTHSRFSDGGDGNTYKEVWPVSEVAADYRAALTTNEGDTTPVDKFIGFKHAIDQGADLSFKWLDPDYVFRYIAADRLIINDDGAFHWYCTIGNHNYYWYEAEHADRVWLIPWDLDGAFEGGSATVHITTPWNGAPPSCTCDGSQIAASCDRLTKHWASRADDYERAVDDFIEGPLAKDKVNAKLSAWIEQVDAVAQEASGHLGAPTYEEWQDALVTLQSVIQSSRQHRGYPYETAEPDPDLDAGAE